jgi:hypothetical protein
MDILHTASFGPACGLPVNASRRRPLWVCSPNSRLCHPDHNPKEKPMKKLALSLVLASFAIAPAFAAMKEKPLKVELAAQNDSGETGYAMLYPHGAKTKVIVHLKGTPKGVAQPDHIHKGTCANLDPKPAYVLKPVVDGKSVTTVHVSVADLLKEPMAINVHESAQDIKKYVACGDIAAPK